MGYAAGHLSEAFSLVVATHVTLCDDCRARLESLEALGGAVLDAEEEAPVSIDALARMMARLDVPVVSAPPMVAPVAWHLGLTNMMHGPNSRHCIHPHHTVLPPPPQL